jgi:hypothetical protein
MWVFMKQGYAFTNVIRFHCPWTWKRLAPVYCERKTFPPP